MAKLKPLKNSRHRDNNLPTIIALNIKYSSDGRELLPLTKFLKHLKSIQENHFIRFTTDIFWANQSNLSDVFYTFDGDINDVSNIQWTVSILENGYINLIVKINKPTENHKNIIDISKRLRSLQYTMDTSPTEDGIVEFGDALLRDSRLNRCIHTLNNTFDLLIVIDKVTNNSVVWYPIPIIGMNREDITSRYQKSLKSLIETFSHRSTIFKKLESTSVNEIILSLYLMICENERDKTISSKFNNTFHHAELLLSYFISSLSKPPKISDHNIVILHKNDFRPNSITSYGTSMDNYEVNKSK